MSESPPLCGSPGIEDSENGQDIREASRKRKAVAKWTKQVRISPGTGLEGPVDDGFSWRKYGQKDILGAKYPRAYYRCTHRNVHGCMATKQVQRSDLDPNIFEVTYCGDHTCAQASQLSNIPPPQQNEQQLSQDFLMNFQAGLRVVTEDMQSQEHLNQFSSTSYANNNTGNGMIFPSFVDPNSLATGGCVSPAFISPATSGTKYFSESTTGPIMSNSQLFQQTSKSELNEIISAATSTSNTSSIGFDFPFGQAEYDPKFPFNSEFFS